MNTQHTPGRSIVLHPQPLDTLRTQCGRGRATYHPEWDSARPWVTYWCGTAGAHFGSAAAAAAYFRSMRGAQLRSPEPPLDVDIFRHERNTIAGEAVRKHLGMQ